MLAACTLVCAVTGAAGWSELSTSTPAVAADTLTTIARPGAAAVSRAVRQTMPMPAAGHFATQPPGAALPSDATCAALVRPTPERRPSNTIANHTAGIGPTDGWPKVTGNFTGTTEEIMQWVACKWGIDEDVVRAQIAKESWWRQDAGGDLTTDQSLCDPLERTTSGPCPESVGLGQIRFRYHGVAFANDNAIKSSALNLDYTYALWRSCYDGDEAFAWLNTVERGAQYAAGDLWGCVGVWFSGRWHVPAAQTYIAAVQDDLADRIWEQPEFQNG